MIKLRDYQQKVVDQVFDAWRNGKQSVGIAMPTGAGKCLAKGTPVLMFDGSIKAVEDVQVGDQLMGPYSKPRNVLSICHGQENLYKVTPVKGDSYTVNESHILSLRITPSGKNERLTAGDGLTYLDNDICNISVLDYLKSSKTFKHRAKGWRVPVEFKQKDDNFYIDPYILGVWLGDGYNYHPSISNVDKEVIREWSYWAKSKGLTVTKVEQENRIAAYNISRPEGSIQGRGHKTNPFRNELERLNLFNNKHIPFEYKTSSRANRLSLLAGLIDTDGYLSHSGYDIVFKQKQLAEDTVFIARSLGFAAYLKPCFKTCTNTGSTGQYYRISISGKCKLIPCKVERRKAPERRIVKNHLVTGITVEPAGYGDYYGFTIDGDHLFLLGDFTVTHNTITFCEIIRQKVSQGHKVAVVMEGEELVRQTAETLNKFEIPAGIIQACNSTFAFAPVQVISIDSYATRPMPFTPTLIVTDEAHRSVSASYEKLYADYPDAYKLGASATWWRLNKQGFNHLYDELIHGPYISELINIWHNTGGVEGLVPPRMFSGNDISDELSHVKTTAGDYNQGQLSQTMSGTAIIGDVVEAYNKHLKGRQTFVFAVDIAHSKRLLQAFTEAGIKAEHLDGKTPDGERKGILKRIKTGETQVVCNVGVCTTGVDVPEVSGIILARPTKSLSLYIQMAGRGLRPANWIGKKDCIIIDCGQNIQEHGHIAEDREWSLEPRGKVKTQIKKTHRPCPQCEEWVAYTLYDCPSCGYHWIKQTREIHVVESNLIELTAQQEVILPEVIKFYRRALRYCKDHGKKPGMAYYKTVEKFGKPEFDKYLDFRLCKRLQREVFGDIKEGVSV